MYRPLLHFITALIISIPVISQKGSISGVIKDAESKIPLSGASVLLPNNQYDHTDPQGIFHMNGLEPGQYEMTVSHIGYKTEIISLAVVSGSISSVQIDLHPSRLDLSTITVNSKRNSALHTIGAFDIRLRPVNNSQDVLRIVPGLIIAQHAGGGKAEQIFLRGYDIDHGTDINITVDGMPVNMVSHAHGQGYADLHFLIPETVEKLSFDKGPYFSSKGDLATAAYVAFSTKDYLDHNSLKLEAGNFHTLRTVGQFKIFDKQREKKREHFYIASEYSITDGYFESPQDFHRFNIMGKYNAWFGDRSQLTILGSTFDSKWKASGQVPERAVNNRMINRFGSIDDSEGGNTSRTNISAILRTVRKNGWQNVNQVYFTNYRFNLYSNFTFFLNDPMNGDMINQRETRYILGYQTSESKNYFIGKNKARIELGTGFRADNIDGISLSKAEKRNFLGFVQLGDLKQRNIFIYGGQDLELGNKWNLHTGIRFDHFIFMYKDRLAGTANFSRQSRGLLSPKLNLNYSPNKNLKFYLNNGYGFHSNDARVILNQPAKEILPRVLGTDLGMIIKPMEDMILKIALWHLYSQQEFVYVGDAGIVEPSGKTRRFGIDFSARTQFNNWLFADIDINLTRARALGETKGEDFVPLAPSFTSVGGLTTKGSKGFSCSIRYRFIDDRPANETNTVRAKGYFLFDMVFAYRLKKFEISLSGENLLNSEWREAQFNTESRLVTEPAPVTEIHYTPGMPRFVKTSISFIF